MSKMQINKYFHPELEKLQQEAANFHDLILEKIQEEEDRKLWEYFEPYLRAAGIKGEITKGKIKWRGIKLKVQNDLGSSKYQLNQRGVDISPVFTVEFGLPLNYR